MMNNKINTQKKSSQSFSVVQLIILAFCAILLFAVGIKSHTQPDLLPEIFGTNGTDTTMPQSKVFTNE